MCRLLFILFICCAANAFSQDLDVRIQPESFDGLVRGDGAMLIKTHRDSFSPRPELSLRISYDLIQVRDFSLRVLRGVHGAPRQLMVSHGTSRQIIDLVNDDTLFIMEQLQPALDHLAATAPSAVMLKTLGDLAQRETLYPSDAVEAANNVGKSLLLLALLDASPTSLTILLEDMTAFAVMEPME